MIVRVWGRINSKELDFTPIADRPGYWEGYGPKNPNSYYEDIEIWAQNDLGARGHLKCQLVIREWSPTSVRLILTPYDLHLIERWSIMVESQTFQFGERRMVTACVRSTSKQPFEIKDAAFSLMRGKEEEASGLCVVEEISPVEMHMSAMISPLRPNAVYRLEFRYRIADEKLIYPCKILVTGGNCDV